MSLFMEAVGSYLRDRRALDELRRLDDRMLSDIGLARGNLEEAVRSGVRTAVRSRRGRPSRNSADEAVH